MGRHVQAVRHGSIKKVSNPSVTTQNGNYSLEGAEFGVYKEASLSGLSRVGVLKTDAKGDSNVLSLQAGTYFVKEIKAPKGYALNPETKTVTISSGRESTVMFEDVPQLCPIEILLRKTDADTGENKPQGAAIFRGARFTVKYYDGLWKEDTDPEKLGKTAKRTWVFETDEDGQCSYGKKHLVSGDALYVDLNGRPAVPIGTVTIQRDKSAGRIFAQSGTVCKTDYGKRKYRIRGYLQYTGCTGAHFKTGFDQKTGRFRRPDSGSEI